MNKFIIQNRKHSVEIGLKLSIIRKELQFSQKELGRKLNKPQSYISKVELGTKQMSLFELSEYLKKLNMKMDTFIKDLSFVKK